MPRGSPKLTAAQSPRGSSDGLAASLQSGDIQARRRQLASQLEAGPDPMVELRLAQLDYISYDFDLALGRAEAAFRTLRRQGRRRAAALAAAAIGRIYFEGLDNQAAARGWFARGATLLEGEGDCVERGWVELGLVGCSVTDVTRLAEQAALAVDLARRHDDLSLEAKALADLGLAEVSLGKVKEGTARIDEAMAIVSTGEVSVFAASQVVCCTLSACERCGDLGRADEWMRVLERASVARPDDHPPTLFSFCHIAYGNLLCEVGRWKEADVALSVARFTARGGLGNIRIGSAIALAELRLRQGRGEEADTLLAQCGDRWETMPARARLHYSRGEYDLAAALIKQAIDQVDSDRARGVPLLALLVDTELARGNLVAAKGAAARASELGDVPELPAVQAQAALAWARVLRASGSDGEAAQTLRVALRNLEGTELPMLRAAMHRELAEAVAVSNQAMAIGEARAALVIHRRLGSPEAEADVDLLLRLGVQVHYDAPPRHDPLGQLSRREREVLALLRQGLSNPVIAERLFISPRTAEHHVSSILSKLGLRSRLEILALELPIA
jgi:DNA-binding CsgD family transcriptional regulator/tetratricopeptide (TPR) repeat protein